MEKHLPPDSGFALNLSRKEGRPALAISINPTWVSLTKDDRPFIGLKVLIQEIDPVLPSFLRMALTPAEALTLAAGLSTIAKLPSEEHLK